MCSDQFGRKKKKVLPKKRQCNIAVQRVRIYLLICIENLVPSNHKRKNLGTLRLMFSPLI